MRIKQWWVSFYTLAKRELVRVLRIWPQSLLPPVITMSLYFTIFGTVMGNRIGSMQGYSYMEYIVPGLVMMGIINSAYMNVIFSFFHNKFQRNIEEMLVAPMPNFLIVAGYVAGGTIRGLLVGLLIVATSLFFVRMSVSYWLVTLTIAAGTAILFSLAGFINGIFAKKFDDTSIVPMFVLTPLTYLGGVFYSIDLLPPAWQKVSCLNPIFYIVNGFRHGVLGSADVSIQQSLCLLIIASIVLFALSVWLMRRGVGIKH